MIKRTRQRSARTLFLLYVYAVYLALLAALPMATTAAMSASFLSGAR